MARECKRTICRACHAGCGVLVEIEDGTPYAVDRDDERDTGLPPMSNIPVRVSKPRADQ